MIVSIDREIFCIYDVPSLSEFGKRLIHVDDDLSGIPLDESTRWRFLVVCDLHLLSDRRPTRRDSCSEIPTRPFRRVVGSWVPSQVQRFEPRYDLRKVGLVVTTTYPSSQTSVKDCDSASLDVQTVHLASAERRQTDTRIFYLPIWALR